MYPYSDPIVMNFAFATAVFNKATVYLNKFSYQFDQFILTLDNGFGEIMATSIADNLRDNV